MPAAIVVMETQIVNTQENTSAYKFLPVNFFFSSLNGFAALALQKIRNIDNLTWTNTNSPLVLDKYSHTIYIVDI